MWFGVTLWMTAVFPFLCLATDSFSDFETPSAYTADPPLASYWNGLEDIYDNSGDLPPLDTWPDSIIVPQQLFGDKSTEGAGSLPKDKRHSLSIVNPLDVLRQRLMLDMARRRMKENQDQIRENALILQNLGKRSGGSAGRNHIRRMERKSL